VDAVKFFFLDMQDAGCFIDDVNAMEYNDTNSLFYSGKALLNTTGTWLVNDIINNVSDYEIDMVPFPSIKGGERLLPGGLGSAWFISSKTEHPQEVAMLLDFMYTDESVKTWVEGVGAVPPLSFDPTGWEIAPLLEFAINTAQAAGKGEAGAALGHYIDTNAPDSFNQMMQDGFQAVVARLKTPEEQLADLQKEWDAGMK
jgi:raffinose/stachyose/melibiose transport system substrate-binding protein